MAPRKWTRQSVIERIRFYHQQGIPVGQIYRQDKGLSLVSYSLFGSWRVALVVARYNLVEMAEARRKEAKDSNWIAMRPASVQSVEVVAARLLASPILQSPTCPQLMS